MSEPEIKMELMESRKWFDSDESTTIRTFLEEKFDILLQLFILHHHFGQAEEHYILMINGEFIVEMEVSKGEIIEYDTYLIKDYFSENKKMPKLFRRRIEIAKGLSAKYTHGAKDLGV